MVNRRRLLLYFTIFVAFSILSGFGLHRLLQPRQIPVATTPSAPKQAPFTGYTDSQCPTEAPWLSRLKIPHPYNYARRDIVVRAQPGLKRSSSTQIPGPLHPDFEPIEQDNTHFKLANCLSPLRLDVPAWPTTHADASILLFGVVTSLSRLQTSIPYWARWLSFTRARLVVMIVGPDDHAAPKRDMRAAEAQLRAAGIAADVVPPLRKDHGMDRRYLSLVKVLYERRSPQTRWVVVMDDDTFFPSMPDLLRTLDTYDHNLSYYLGAMSEEWWTVGRYSFMAMGGAGIFLSIPLLAALQPLYQRCQDESGASAGDLRIFECIKWYDPAHTRLTHVPGLYQFDFNGDRSGFFEGGRQALSLHHWKQGWWDEGNLGNDRLGRETWFPMDAMHLVYDVCGTCFLQRWRVGNETVLGNGYSISTYPTGALENFEPYRGLEKLEETWGHPGTVEGSLNSGWEHYLGITRPMLELEVEKVQWRFLDAWEAEGGG
ncbi:uncharacterized protein KY384_001285 [Bacidia gigantensis]|uniref:uncharacterized protein n=1 Tax=Bacidia gigantensis TaxID=2732470 RepID=UPI001D050ED9|nr:uncharacterized protein KY384_001285 [Bacidia gigantensis]KAG8533545.1 hypothetical protein KY384_001285 [Bacidia gigantensis]